MASGRVKTTPSLLSIKICCHALRCLEVGGRTSLMSESLRSKNVRVPLKRLTMNFQRWTLSRFMPLSLSWIVSRKRRRSSGNKGLGRIGFDGVIRTLDGSIKKAQSRSARMRLKVFWIPLDNGLRTLRLLKIPFANTSKSCFPLQTQLIKPLKMC